VPSQNMKIHKRQSPTKSVMLIYMPQNYKRKDSSRVIINEINLEDLRDIDL
jgi:hypothetical protein